ncbi:MAG: hypothetical protein ABSG02_22050 [Terriglobales bacterium]|jgi:hypothetical protein
MSDETTKPGLPADDTGFEHEDLSTRGIVAFMVGLAVTGVVIYFIIVGMYSYLDKIEREQMATASPLSTSTGVTSRVVTQAEMEKTFKDNGAPMLEVIEGVELRKDLVKQEEQLNSYGWVDQKAGVAHIPIERAMELIAQRGLPTVQQGSVQYTCLHGGPLVDCSMPHSGPPPVPAPKSAGKGQSSAQ